MRLTRCSARCREADVTRPRGGRGGRTGAGGGCGRSPRAGRPC
jgi:hypothetical protein